MQPPVVAAPIVTPETGPASQEPPRPIVVQNAAVGLGAFAVTNTLTAGLTGTPEILWCSAGLNAAAQGVKQVTWFNEKLWTVWFLLLAGIFVMCWYYRDPAHWDLTHFWLPGYFDLPVKGVLQGASSAYQALANFHSLQATGVSPLPPTPFERSVEARAVPMPTPDPTVIRG